jgi:hypothetical protein
MTKVDLKKTSGGQLSPSFKNWPIQCFSRFLQYITPNFVSFSCRLHFNLYVFTFFCNCRRVLLAPL